MNLPLGLAETPPPPYYAVIFTSQRSAEDEAGYHETSEAMSRLVTDQPGYLGHESVRGADGVGITVAYFSSLEAIKVWKMQKDHRAAQQKGRETWYRAYVLRVARVERAYDFFA